MYTKKVHLYTLAQHNASQYWWIAWMDAVACSLFRPVQTIMVHHIFLSIKSNTTKPYTTSTYTKVYAYVHLCVVPSNETSRFLLLSVTFNANKCYISEFGSCHTGIINDDSINFKWWWNYSSSILCHMLCNQRDQSPVHKGGRAEMGQ